MAGHIMSSIEFTNNIRSTTYQSTVICKYLFDIIQKEMILTRQSYHIYYERDRITTTCD